MFIMVKIKITPEFSGIFRGNIQDLQDKENQEKGLREIRGNVIAICVDIESQLNYLITDLLFGGVKNRQSDKPHELKGEIRFFQDFILNTNYIQLGSKVKIFRSLIDTCSFFEDSKKEAKDLSTNLRSVMEWRDNFAHGDIMFETTQEGISEKPYLFYYKKNKPQRQILNDEFFDNVMNPLFSDTLNKIVEIRNSLNKKFEKEKPSFEFL